MLPAEPEDDVPDAVHHATSHLDDGDDGDVGVDGDSDDHAAGHLRWLLELLLGQAWNNQSTHDVTEKTFG